MTPIVYLVRHAQGYHNISIENHELQDPDLTPLGESQCNDLREKFTDHDQITHLVASPMRRTLHTCLRSFAPAVEKGLRIVALPEAQEVSAQPCNRGSDAASRKAEFGDKVDLSLVKDGWDDKSSGSKYEPATIKLEARAHEVRVFMRDLVRRHGPDARVVLVSHGRILHYITEDWSDVPEDKCTGWDNAEIRAFEFISIHGEDSSATLKRVPMSW